jgi:ElaB/YqjD/DUF883 family membrane-anchored ribosome-binding protein
MTTELEKDIDALKKDLGKFRDDIGEVLSDVGHYSQDKVRQTRQRLASAMEDFEGMAARKFSHANEVVRDRARKYADSSREMVSEKPFAAVAVSFAAGMAAAMLLRKHDHE